MIRHEYSRKDFEQFFERQKQIVQTTKREVPKRAIQRATALVVRRVKIKIKEKGLIRSGNYRRSVNAVVRKIAGDVWTGAVGTWVHYAEWLEDGTRPHIISPRNGKRLVFAGKDGKIVSVPYVYHPGTKAYKVFTESIGESFDEIVAIIVEELDLVNKPGGKVK